MIHVAIVLRRLVLRLLRLPRSFQGRASFHSNIPTPVEFEIVKKTRCAQVPVRR